MQQPSVGVSVDPLKDAIRDADIIRIQGELPNWQLVAKKLDMGFQDIKDIETNHRAPEDQRVGFLNKWIEKKGAAATYEKLIVALKSLGQQGAAERINSKKLYAEAMQCGYVERKVIKCLIVGAAGVGKTSIKHLILNKELPKQRESTGVMENPVLAVSLRSVAIACANLKEDNSWHVIHNDEELIKMIAEHINAGQVHKRNISEFVENSAETESPAEIISNKWISAIMETKGGGEKLLTTTWIQFIDSGGQPEFHDLLPVFVPNTSVVLLVFKVSEELDKKPMVEYYSPMGCIGNPYESYLTNREILEHCLYVFHALTGECPTILLIGTHKDQCEHEAKIKEWQESITKVPTAKVVRFGNFEKQCIASVNCKAGEKENGKIIEEIRDQILQVEVKSEETPIAWFVLEHTLKNASRIEKSKRKGILTYEQCKLEADKIEFFKTNSGQFEEALKHLVKYNIFIHYPEVLKDLVLCDPQLLLSMVTLIVRHHYILKSSKDAAINETMSRFVKYAYISAKILKTILAKYSKQDVFLSPNECLILLTHLKIISAVEKIDNSDLYLMPALLPRVNNPDANIDKHLAPLHIRFGGGCAPSGMFCSLVTTLLQPAQPQLWTLCKRDGIPYCCFRNCVTFCYKETTNYTITLVDAFSHFSIYMHIPTCFKIPRGFPLIIRNKIHESINAVAERLKYSKPVLEDAIICTYQHTELDPSDPNYNHLAVYQPTELDPSDPNYKKIFQCKYDDNCQVPIPDEYRVWMETTAKLGQQPSMQQPSVVVSVDPLRGKIRDADISRIAGDLPQWQIVASKLGMGQLDINDIEINHRGTTDQRMAFLRKWIFRDGAAATYEKLSEVLETLGERGAAEKIRDIGE